MWLQKCCQSVLEATTEEVPVTPLFAFGRSSIVGTRLRRMEPPGPHQRATMSVEAVLECGYLVGDPGDKREIWIALGVLLIPCLVRAEEGRGRKGFTMTVCAQRLSHTPNKEHSQQEATACHRKGNFRCHLQRRTDTSSCERPFPALLPYEICITHLKAEAVLMWHK